MGKTRDILDSAAERYRAERLAQTVTQRCTFCGWHVTGTMNETQALALAHRKDKHPEAVAKTRRIRPRSVVRALGTRTLDENIAAARQQGASTWANPDQLYDQ